MDIENELTHVAFLKLVVKSAVIPFSLIILGLSSVLVMAKIDHSINYVIYAIVGISVVKTLAFALFTLQQVTVIVKLCRSVSQLFLVFGLLAGLIVFSFATDYNCMFMSDPTAFRWAGVPPDGGLLFGIYSFFYFSLVTFASVGYGDIVPITPLARLLVIFEITLSFFVVVFAIANLKNIHIRDRN